MIADDHPVFRAGLKKIINDIPAFSVIAEAGNKEELYRLLQYNSCEIIIVDMKMQGFLDGLDILEKIKTKWPKIKVLVLSQYYKKNIIEQAISLDADGYITKDDVFQTIVMSLKKISKGEKAFSQKVKSFMFDNIISSNFKIDALTPKEKEVLTLIVQGKKRSEIAEVLNIAITTVDFHKMNIKSKLNTKSDMDLFELAKEYGLI